MVLEAELNTYAKAEEIPRPSLLQITSLHFIDRWTNQRQTRKQRVTQCFVDICKAFNSITRKRLYRRIHALKNTSTWYALYEKALVHVRCICGQSKVITSTINVKQGCMHTLPHPRRVQHRRGSTAHHIFKVRGNLIKLGTHIHVLLYAFMTLSWCSSLCIHDIIVLFFFMHSWHYRDVWI